MWEYEHSVETSAPRERLWRRWTDVASWPSWNEDIVRIEMDGHFAVGTRIVMTPPEGDKVTLRIAAIEPGESFTDEADCGDFTITTVHRLTPLPDGRTRVTYRTEITGPLADEVGPALGPQITADFPDVLAALVALAES
ncbi:polyketide cyclase [Actinomadura logoneensis]|uniref:Polyketide cyclase n=1 Tax=Actinomadura logoneensis TaxID=2293572 RepID=A0A372JL65_9ACTN|nr:SRPBCC family protein [Actinomadura logoneensis]RFU40757.1 polyketide cyclase [Actinomadura logoneensis]